MITSPLGIDISKRTFDACLIREGGKLRHRSFPNSADGFAQLSAWLTKYKAEQVRACLEATGAYGEALSTYLYEAGHTVSVINPAVIKAYGESRLSRAKTDKADAALLARFCEERQLSKTGAPRLRKALYFPAVVAIRHNPYVKEMSERLKERGKCTMQIIGAAMPKLLHLAYGVLKSGRPFDPGMKTA